MSVDIDNMPAGPEINALVAVEAMGWFEKDGILFSPCHRDWSDDELSRCGGSVPPDYSRDILVAWKIAEKIDMPFYIIKCYNPATFPNEMEKGWLVNWCDDGDCRCSNLAHDGFCPNGNEIWAKTAPLAICRGALKKAKMKLEVDKK